MPSGGGAPLSLRRLLAVLVVACVAPLGVGALVELSSDHGTLLLGPAATHQPVEPTGGAAGDGARDAGDRVRSQPPAGGDGAPGGSPSSTAMSTTSTTTTAPTPSSTTTAAPATAAPPPDPTTTASQAAHGTETDAVVALTNDARAGAGCPALVVDGRLAAAAQDHADDMAAHDYFSHTSLDGATFADRARAAGYAQPGGENIARGQRSAEAVVSAWMDSPGHRANILNCDFRAIGVGLDEGEWVWVQVFGY
ncbi:MAG: CAP domain-containing protein [Acidimicrobiia bacterium]